MISVEISHWTVPGYIGAELTPPVPTAPRIVRLLLDAPEWIASSGDANLYTYPVPIEIGDGKDFYHLLQDGVRTVPIILISRKQANGTYPVDAKRLAHILAGTACIYTVDSDDVDQELRWLLPPKFVCRSGMIRVYQPGVVFTYEPDHRRHRYFLLGQTEEVGPERVVDMIVRGVARRSRLLGLDSVTSVDDVIRRKREARLREFREHHEGNTREWVQLLEEENASLSESYQALQSRLSDAERTRELREDENDLLESEMHSMKGELRYLREQLNEERERTQRLEEQRHTLNNFDQLPSSLAEVANAIQAIHPDKIYFTERAQESASSATFGDISIAWRCLWSVATDLYSLYFDEQDTSSIDAAFKERTGFDLALTETGTTKSDKKLMALREDTFRGKKIDIVPHVKYGQRPPRCLRVHYFVDRDDRLIVVGHCGDHLDTSGTRRRS